MTLLTTPIYDFHKVLSALKIQLKTVILTPSLVITSLHARCHFMALTGKILVFLIGVRLWRSSQMEVRLDSLLISCPCQTFMPGK